MTSPHGPPPLILKSTSPLTHANHATSSPFVMSNPLYNPPSKDATSSSHHWAPYSNFLDIPEQIFAQQLTKMDCVRKTCNIFCTINSSFLFSVKKVEFFLLTKNVIVFLQELFKRVIPHQCLGAVWSRRKEKTTRDKEAGTVVATVDQVNNYFVCLWIKKIKPNNKK